MKAHVYFKRFLSLLLVASALIGLLPVAMVPEAQAAEGWDVDEDGTLSILCIGNSFSVDAMEYVYQIANNLGITKIYLGNLYIGGCSLATHWTNASGDLAKYTYYTNTAGSWSKKDSQKMSTALTSRSWDYVSMQQASPNSGQADTYNSNLTNLVSYVKGKCPNSKLVWHMTWAYQGNSTHSGFANYNKNQTTMYDSIVSATKSKIANNSDFSIIVPSGTAIQNARTSLIKDNLCRDGYHLNKNIGRYIAGLTFFKAVTGLDISKVTFRAANVPDGYHAIAIESATNAVATPFSVTTSAHTNPASSPYYTQKSLSLKALSYWNSKDDTDYLKQITNASNSSQYYSTQRFNIHGLPVGSVITLTANSGWQYRPEGWLNNAKQTSRKNPTTATYTVCSEEWWLNPDGKPYLYRAFNLSKTNGSKLDKNQGDTIKGIFKIYVPKEYVTSDLSPDLLDGNIASLADPIPNNKRVKWDNASKVNSYFAEANWDRKYLIVSDSSTTGSKSYVMDPSTPRLFGTINAVQVTVSSKSGTERVYGADPNWAMQMGTRDDPFTTVSTSATTFRSPFRIAFLKSYQKLTDTYDGNYFAFRSKEWKFYNSSAFGSSAYGAGIRPNLFFNTNSDRFHFFVESQYDSGKTSVRSMFTNPGTDAPFFSMGTGELGDSGKYACFYVYVIEDKANTEALYAKLKEVKKYIHVDHTYYEKEYATFLDALNTAYSVYNAANGKTYNQTTVNNALTALTNATKALNAKNMIEYMSIPYNKKIDGDAKVGTAAALEGTYFMDRLYEGNVDAVHSFMNTAVYKDTNSNGNADSYGIVRMNVGTNGVIASNLTHAITLRHVKGTTNGYTIQFEGRDFLNRTGDAWRLNGLSNPQTFYFKDAAYNSIADLVSVYDYSDQFMLYCDAGDEYYWRLYDKTAGVVKDKPERFGFRLFQCSPTTLELYRALQFIKPYCDQDEAIKRYPRELYTAFLADVKSAMSNYTTYNNNGAFADANRKKTLDAMASNIRSWADRLTQADMTLEYIDIPVEVFDFKADGVMFEYDDGYYGLVGSGTYTPALPGQIYYYKNGVVSTTDNGGNTMRRGLTESTLVDGKLVYKEQTIAHVAARILADDTNRGTSSKYLDQDGAAYNKDFFTKIGKITALGTYKETLAKTTTGKNGGDLDWNEVVTAFDMAYYVLTYLWREVPKTAANKLSSGDTYNMRVPQRDILRLYKEESSNLYTFYSEDNMAYHGYYMYNTIPTIDNPPISNYADFTPVNQLGFEENGVETDASRYYANHGWVDKYETDNYHYVVHAYGSFVYYEDQNLKFEFIGDDDVYFYINGNLAMDLGGAHSALGDKLELNNFKMADGSKLVDGEIYSFDMYYAERHTHASNMKLNTNIKIVDTDTLTAKGQYLEVSGEENMVDPDGRGVELTDNAMVNIGDTVAYSFDILNSRDVPVYDLTFDDSSIGVYLSPQIVALPEPEDNNNTEYRISDINVYYRSYNNGVLNQSDFILKTVAEMEAIINGTHTATNYLPMPTGSYRVKIETEEDLMKLLALGVPRNCQISVYGFKRKTVETDRPYMNTVKSLCSYLPLDSAATEADARTIAGMASRIIQVPDPATFVLPTADPCQIVIDYGKPVNIPLEELRNHIYVSYKMSVGDYMGVTTAGYNGAPLRRAPVDMVCVTSPAAGKNNVLSSRYGAFSLGDDVLTFRPTQFVEGSETVYAVFKLNGCTGFSGDGTSSVVYEYVQVAVQIFPATMMYYETDFAEGIFDLQQVKDGVIVPNDLEAVDGTNGGWSTQIDESGAEDPSQSYDHVGNTNYMLQKGSADSLYFGFDNQPSDQSRYEGYKGTASVNYDVYSGSNKSWWGADRKVAADGIRTDNIHGILELTSVETLEDSLFPDIFVDTASTGSRFDMPLKYDAKNAQIYQIRFKMSGFRVGDWGTESFSVDPFVTFQFMANGDSSDENIITQTTGDLTFDTAYLNNNEYVTVTGKIYDSIRSYSNINRIRLYFGGIESMENTQGKITIDYAYIGPGEMAPDPVYGYDSSYENDTQLSNGSSLFVEGAGVKLNEDTKSYTEASFTFTGTGFDIISRTGNQQGTIRVTVYDANGEAERKLSVNNKGELELYQIPVVSIDDLPYGEHRVVIGVNKAMVYTGILAPLSVGGEFYFDGIRIYNPVSTLEGELHKDSQSTLNVYRKEQEAYPYIKEVRDVLLSADDFNALVGESNGAVFVDQAEEKPSYPEIPAPDGSEPTEYVPIDPETGKPVESLPVDPDLNVDNHITDRIITYEKVGPKNEVYLGSGQSVAFKIRLNTVQTPVSIDVGAKTIDKNDTAVLSVGHTTTAEAPASRQEWTVSSNTAMYYATDITADSFDEGRCLYLVITNTDADSVLSITDIKFAYDTEPTLIQEGQPPVTRSAPVGDLVSFTVDGGLAEAVQKVLDAELPMDEPEILDETIAIRHTLNLASDIAVNYVVERAVVDAYDSAVLEVKVPVYEGNALVGYETVILEPVDKGYYYYFILEGLTAVHMNDMLEATLRLEKDGIKTVSATDVYSIATYAYGQLNKTGISESLQKLCADLLQYGARAQIFKGYRTEALADSLMTAEQRALVTDLATVTFGNTYAVGTELAEPSITWIGKALELNSKVGLKFVFSAQGYEGAVEDLTLRATYVNAVGQTCTAVVEGPVAYNQAAAQYAFLFDGLTAAELRQAVKVQIYNGDTPLSCTMTYSADTYGNGKTGTLLDLCRALFAYSDSAKAYFAG